MATTRTRSTPSRNGAGPAGVGATAKQAGETVASAARQARGPLLAAGAAAAGLAGGLTIGSRMGSRRSGVSKLLAPRRKVLGVPVGPQGGVVKTAKVLRDGAKHLRSTAGQMSTTTDEIRRAREELEKTNRRSPVEVLLDGLTHRRGAHRNES